MLNVMYALPVYFGYLTFQPKTPVCDKAQHRFLTMTLSCCQKEPNPFRQSCRENHCLFHIYTPYVKAPGDMVAMLYGVPQGSVLGPLLLMLYLAEVFAVVKQFGLLVHGYADDLQLYDHAAPSACVHVTGITAL